ncbi:LOW QUALITY PROTEIN: polycystin-2-like [Drosophila nasuta]|uniref:LOW QUALITY PROTEIN: polycystin-2-like n=1 Tax=Drosophila nasuta TaxID=42062 RepID=UPI00295ED734|nr:LOW QUALITY PROTEIN: polycystin-2-like [Drosophila nasuta]
MKKKSSRRLFFLLTVFIILCCVGVAYYFAGVEHETEHLKNMLVSIVIVLLFQMIIAEPIKFILFAIDEATWPSKIPKYSPYEPEEDEKYNRLDFLKQRLPGLRVQMLINERYRDYTLNDEYKLIVEDLFLYGKYFLVLTLMVLVHRDELLYHNTKMMQRLFTDNHTDYMGLKNVYHLNQLFDFVQSSLVTAFDSDDEDTGVNYWVHSEPNKMLGVARLRQLRLIREQFGWNDPEFSNLKYMPNWELPYRRLHYADKYWRIYEPWLPIDDHSDLMDAILMNFDHVGYFQNYPELRGYVTVLARNKQNSMKILDFLSEYNWLNYNTSVVFLDFTLYNVDANMFSVCTLRVENTPFGSIIPKVDCDSVRLIEELEQLSFGSIIVLVIYIIVVLQFSYAFVRTVWYTPVKIKSFWNKMDLIIIVLNVLVIGLMLVRATIVHGLLKRLEGANKLEYLNFHAPARLHSLTTILIGFLICLTTLRLWRVLQFSKVFLLFTQTFALAWKAFAMTIAMIMITLVAFGIAFVIINGNNSVHFLRVITSITTTLCFACGFSTTINPKEVLYGGFYLGILLYAMMGFVVTILLMNVLITTIADYFQTARAVRDAQTKRRISFFEFLRVEYSGFFEFFLRKLPWWRKPYKRNNRTVAENIQRKLDRRELSAKSKLRRKREVISASRQKPPPPKDEETLQAEYRDRIEHVLAVSNMLNTQMEILKLMLIARNSTKKETTEQDKNNPFVDTDESSEDEIKKPQGRKPNTNTK